jgi:hypothetical protein
MPVICVRTYEVRCDGILPNGKKCGNSEGSQLDPEPVIEDALFAGWLRRGRKTYCTDCRGAYEAKIRSTVIVERFDQPS